MAVTVQHSDGQYQALREMTSLRNAVTLGLTNTQVAAADTNALLQSTILGLATHGEFKYVLSQINRAVSNASALGIATDSNLNALTTTAGLLGLFITAAPGIGGVTTATDAGMAYE